MLLWSIINAYSLLMCFLTIVICPVLAANEDLEWMVGKWRSEWGGKVTWPTIPNLVYGEELTIQQAPLAKSSGVQFLNFSAFAFDHTNKDHFHDEWGFMSSDSHGMTTLMTAGNNGFTTYEVGPVTPGRLTLTTKDFGRLSFARDLPVEALSRTFILHDDGSLEQTLEMRTSTHPKTGTLVHTRVIYKRIE